MKDLLALIEKFIADSKQKANAALTGLPPVDQFQGAQEITNVINTMKWFKDDLAQMDQRIAGIAAKFEEEIAKAESAKIAAELEAGTLVKKSDSDAAVTAAESRVRQEEADKAAAAKKTADLVSARRAEITTAHGAEVAAALPSDILAAETFDGVKSEVARRVAELGEIGVTVASRKDTFTEILTEAPFTDEGKAVFDKQITRIREIAGIKPGTATFSRPGLPGSGQPTVPAGGSPERQPGTEETGTVSAAF